MDTVRWTSRGLMSLMSSSRKKMRRYPSILASRRPTFRFVLRSVTYHEQESGRSSLILARAGVSSSL